VAFLYFCWFIPCETAAHGICNLFHCLAASETATVLKLPRAYVEVDPDVGVN